MRQRHGCGELLVQPRRCSAAKSIGDSNTRALALAHAQIRRKTHHDPPVKLLDKADFFWVCLLGSTRPISLLVHLRWFLILEDAINVCELGRLLARFLVMGSRGGHVVVRERLMVEKFSLDVPDPVYLWPRPLIIVGSGENGGRRRTSEPGLWGKVVNNLG